MAATPSASGANAARPTAWPVLRRGDFASVTAFAERLTWWLTDYNARQAHPYRWTCTGEPLVRAAPSSQTRPQRRQGKAWSAALPGHWNGCSIRHALTIENNARWRRICESVIQPIRTKMVGATAVSAVGSAARWLLVRHG